MLGFSSCGLPAGLAKRPLAVRCPRQRIRRGPYANLDDRILDIDSKFFVFGPDQESPAPLNAPPLQLGPLTIDPPIILAPMAGVTDYPFRKLCAEHGAALYVSEMLLARNVAEGRPEGRARFGPQESPRSAQLYGTDPGVMRAAAERLILEQHVQHIDLNFGCPALKVMRKGGGAAIPDNPELLRSIVTAVVEAARPYNIPVTAKIRLGVDWLSLNYINAGHIIEDCGGAAVILHARTAADKYLEGTARTSRIHIAVLRSELNIPVLGNGDIFTASEALRVMRSTLCAGVAIGRGCLGRPWLFQDLASAFRTRWASEVTVPPFQVVADTMLGHLESSVAWQAQDGVNEASAVSSMRKWFGWYWRGYNGLPGLWVPRMCKASTVEAVREIVAEADPNNVSYDFNIIVGSRGKQDFEVGYRKEPLAPTPPKKSASQRLPKSEEGLARRKAKIDAKWEEFQRQKDNLKQHRRERAQPKRRAFAKNVQNELARIEAKNELKTKKRIDRSGATEMSGSTKKVQTIREGFREAEIYKDEVKDLGISDVAGG